MKHYYATGNDGYGTSVYAFESKFLRDDFVAWYTSYDNRRAITRHDARKHYKKVTLLAGQGPLMSVVLT